MVQRSDGTEDFLGYADRAAAGSREAAFLSLVAAAPSSFSSALSSPRHQSAEAPSISLCSSSSTAKYRSLLLHRQTSSQSKHQPSSLPNQSAAQHLLLRFCQRRASKPAACNFSLCSSRHQRLLVFYPMAGTSHSNSTELIELLMFSLLARSICML
ncbi:hypothetical protein SETIT_9G121700v2 [Setaria italica]|uniref:Uncharacterized protein n=1 Tax=Setaria italica TaxID=4555 RepID=A0A368SFP4_SETIT|nr:hypothetical protein SETIT_9G121700v2 [Setaria italica]